MQAATPNSHPSGASLVAGFMGLALGLAAAFTKLHRPIEIWLMESVTGQADALLPHWPKPASFCYLAGAAFLTPWCLARIEHAGQRLLLWMLAGILTLTFCLSLMICGIWFDPVPALLAGLWAGGAKMLHLSSKSKAPLSSSQAQETAPAQAADPANREKPSSELDANEDEWKEFRQP